MKIPLEIFGGEVSNEFQLSFSAFLIKKLPGSERSEEKVGQELSRRSKSSTTGEGSLESSNSGMCPTAWSMPFGFWKWWFDAGGMSLFVPLV